VHYGTIWKVYIDAEDPDGDMLRIVSVVDQVGYGRYPAQWVYLKPQPEKHLRGYLQDNLNSKTTGPLNDGTPISLKVSVSTRRGMKVMGWFFNLHSCQEGRPAWSPCSLRPGG